MNLLYFNIIAYNNNSKYQYFNAVKIKLILPFFS